MRSVGVRGGEMCVEVRTGGKFGEGLGGKREGVGCRCGGGGGVDSHCCERVRMRREKNDPTARSERRWQRQRREGGRWGKN